MPKAVKIVDHSGRARQKDYDTVVKEVIKVARDLFEVRLLTADAFPSASLENEWVAAVWADACQHEGVKYCITPDLHKMVSTFLIKSLLCQHLLDLISLLAEGPICGAN